MRNFSFSLPAVTCTMLVAALSCSQAPSIRHVLEKYADLLSSHQIDELMKLYSDDIKFDIPSFDMHLSGKSALRGVAEYDSVLNTEMTLNDITSVGDTAFCEIVETNDWMEAAGISSAVYPRALFVVTDGRISQVMAELSDSSAAEFSRVLSQFVPWAEENHPREMARMMPGGRFIYNAQNGQTVVGILRQWRHATTSEDSD